MRKTPRVLSPGLMRGRKAGATNLTDEERAEILRLTTSTDWSATKIAKELGRCPKTVATFLASFKSTGALARAYFEKESYGLAQRVVEQADVDQSLDVLDRLDILPKKRGEESGRPSVVVCVGMPGAPALMPPAQVFVTRALEAAKETT